MRGILFERIADGIIERSCAMGVEEFEQPPGKDPEVMAALGGEDNETHLSALSGTLSPPEGRARGNVYPTTRSW